MQKIVLGNDVPELLVILHSGFTNKFGIRLLVEPEALIGITAKLKIGDIVCDSVLDVTTYIWTISSEVIDEIHSLSLAVISLGNAEDSIKLTSGKVEVRL